MTSMLRIEKVNLSLYIHIGLLDYKVCITLVKNKILPIISP